MEDVIQDNSKTRNILIGDSNQANEEERAARSMLLYHTKKPLAALMLTTKVSDAVRKLKDSNPYATEEQIDRLREECIQDMGYITDLASFKSQQNYMDAYHAGLFCGDYAIIDSKDNLHRLIIGSQSIRFLLNGKDEVVNVLSEGEHYNSQRITIKNKKIELNIKLNTPIEKLNSGSNFKEIIDSYKVTVTGSMTLIAEDNKDELVLVGKAGVKTPAGIRYEKGYEPPFIWAGEYVVRYTDNDNWDFLEEALNILYDTNEHTLSLYLGKVKATDLYYTHNVMGCKLERKKGVVTNVSMKCCISMNGKRKLFIRFDEDKKNRNLSAYSKIRLKKSTLWGEPVSLAAEVSAKNVARITGKQTSPIFPFTTDGDDITREQSLFCRTVYDSNLMAADLFPLTETNTPAEGEGPKEENSLFKGSTISLVKDDVNQEGEITGFRVDELDESKNKTGRIAIYNTDDVTSEWEIPDGASLKHYQQLDLDMKPKPGLENVRLGFSSELTHELPRLVETDFYECRLNLLDYGSYCGDGVSIELAIDDPDQGKLLTTSKATNATCHKVSPVGLGPDIKISNVITADNGTVVKIEGDVPDFTKASVLIRATSGETQVAGSHYYHFSMIPKTKGRSGFYDVSKYICEPTEEGPYKLVSKSTESVPILIRTLINMGSADEIALSGEDWPPAYRSKHYEARVTAMKGVQPFTWRLIKNDIPAGLDWDHDAKVGKDIDESGLISFGVSGTVDDSEDPGTTHQPLIRVMNHKDAIMAPTLVIPHIQISEPEIEDQKSRDDGLIALAAVEGCAGLVGLALAIILGAKELNKKDEETTDKDLELKARQLIGKIEHENEENIQRLGDEINRISTRFADLEVETRTNIEDNINDIDHKIEKMRNTLTERNKRISDLESKLEELEFENNNENGRLSSEIYNLEREIDELKNANEDLRSRQEEFQKEEEALEESGASHHEVEV
ncbi:hypothetical protein ACJJIQ_07670 [Microbulbifer sp. ANSA003]|uniref:hypothetical protein n=1 Tax=Microbulbifer sp. ANSA003 TaxID=3243360 RepID=UPI00404130F1